MNRQYRRRIKREWDKIRKGCVCTEFVERNGLFTIPYVIVFQAIKISDDILCVYTVGILEFQKDFGHTERLTVCQFSNSLFRSLCSVELGFVSEDDLEENEEIML